MKVSSFEIANILIVAFLFFILTRKKDAVTLLLVLFIYSTLHFSFAVFALASNESSSLLIAIHNEGGGMLAKLSTLSLMGIAFFLLSRHAYDAFLLSHRSEKKLAFQILLVMAAVLCGYILNYRHGDWLQLKNILSLEGMLAFILIGFFGVFGKNTTNPAKIYPWALGVLVILSATDFIAIYEVFYHQSWAGTLENSGSMVYRASSILFNPNLLGFWAAMLYLGCSYGMNEYKEYRKIILLAMVLASIAIYFSGSRSAGYLLLGVTFLPALLIRERFYLLPLIVLPFTMLTIYVLTVWFLMPIAQSSEGWSEIALLGMRFSATLPYVINYLFMHFDLPLTRIGSFDDLPPEVVQSIEGRFTGGLEDSGWLVLYDDAGMLGLAAVIFACCMLVLRGGRAYVSHPSASTVYLLAMLIYILMTGLVMRFQIFPVWMFISLVIVTCLVFWQRLGSSTSLIRS